MPGDGWRAASLRTPHLPSWLLAAPALIAAALSALPLVRRPVIRLAQAAVTAAEAPVSQPLNEWHRYRLRWDEDGAAFWVDERKVLDVPRPPRGPLGFVAWIDNQYAVVSPRKGLRFGVLPTDTEQRLEIEGLRIKSGHAA